MTRRSESERWCSVCEQSVFMLSTMTESRARALLESRAGQRICINYAVDAADQVEFARQILPLPTWALALVLATSGCLGFDRKDIETLDELEAEAWPDWSIEPMLEPMPEPDLEIDTIDTIDIAPTGDGIEPVENPECVPNPADALFPMPGPDSEFGQIIVVVLSDSGDRPIPDAGVWISAGREGIEGETNAQGIEGFDGLAAGVYTLVVGVGSSSKRLKVGVEPGGRSKVTLRLDHWVSMASDYGRPLMSGMVDIRDEHRRLPDCPTPTARPPERED